MHNIETIETDDSSVKIENVSASCDIDVVTEECVSNDDTETINQASENETGKNVVSQDESNTTEEQPQETKISLENIKQNSFDKLLQTNKEIVNSLKLAEIEIEKLTLHNEKTVTLFV